ncbi:ABC transporter permease [Pseudoalteromonas luteoviolacea]
MMISKLNRHSLVYYACAFSLCIFAITLSDTAFFTVTNFLNIFVQTAPIVVMAIGLSFALSAGRIDLSIGATVALCGLVTAWLLPQYGAIIAVIVAILLGAAIGAFNGYLCEHLAVHSLIVTLGVLGLLTGIARQLSGLQSLPIVNIQFIELFGHGALLGVPNLILWLGGSALVAQIVLAKLRFGSHLVAVGTDQSAAYRMGLKVSRIRIMAMTLCGAFCAFAGVLYGARMQSARYSIGESDLMVVIAAVAIGGGNLLGGRVNIFGVVLGVWLIGAINNALILSGFSSNEQMMVKGAILIMAVAMTAQVKK